jgi:hypothetical protein
VLARAWKLRLPPVVAPIYDWTGFYNGGDSKRRYQLNAGPRRFARIRKQGRWRRSTGSFTRA